MDKKLKETPLAQQVKKTTSLVDMAKKMESQRTDSGQGPSKEKLSVDKEYLQYRLDELIKANAAVINEYSYLMSVLHPPLPIVKE